MEIAKLVLEFLKVLAGWPIVVGIIAIYFFKKFSGAIEDFLRRIQEGEGYGFKLKAGAPSDQQKQAADLKPLPPIDEAEQFVKENPKAAVLEYRKLLNSFRWEKTFNIIYGTQLHLLEFLEKKGSSGEKYINLLPFYNEFIKRSKLTSVEFANYLGFLKGADYIVMEGPESDIVVKITPYGIDFLSYIRGQYPYYNGKPL